VVTNFGSDIMHGHGDELGHPAYHADLTIDYGIRYVWRGRVTSTIGQVIPANLRGVFNWRHPMASGRTLLTEAAKRRLASRGDVKYAMHGPNETLRPITLRDGRPVYEFMRCNPHWGGVSSCDQGRHIGEVLTDSFLNRLVERSGICILYTHLGKIDNPGVPFDGKAITGFRRLAEAFRGGKILVTTTRRLLGYCRAVREIMYNSVYNRDVLSIHVNTRSTKPKIAGLSMKDLDGLTLYVLDPSLTSVVIDGKEITAVRYNPPDHTSRPSVSLPWPKLEFPVV